MKKILLALAIATAAAPASASSFGFHFQGRDGSAFSMHFGDQRYHRKRRTDRHERLEIGQSVTGHRIVCRNGSYKQFKTVTGADGDKHVILVTKCH